MERNVYCVIHNRLQFEPILSEYKAVHILTCYILQILFSNILLPCRPLWSLPFRLFDQILHALHQHLEWFSQSVKATNMNILNYVYLRESMSLLLLFVQSAPRQNLNFRFVTGTKFSLCEGTNMLSMCPFVRVNIGRWNREKVWEFFVELVTNIIPSDSTDLVAVSRPTCQVAGFRLRRKI